MTQATVAILARLASKKISCGTSTSIAAQRGNADELCAARGYRAAYLQRQKAAATAPRRRLEGGRTRRAMAAEEKVSVAASRFDIVPLWFEHYIWLHCALHTCCATCPHFTCLLYRPAYYYLPYYRSAFRYPHT